MLEFVNYDKSGLQLALSGKINVENAKEFADSLTQIRQQYPEGKVTIDTDKLTYISSAGLRVLLTLAKSEHEKPSLTEVHPDFMDILEDTGFTQLFDIHKQIKSISIDGCKMIGKGANGEVYRISDEQIVKVFREGVPLSYVRNERDVAQKALLYGLPTAITFAVVKVGNSYGSVFELLNAISLSNTIAEDPASFDRFRDEYVSILKTLHDTKVDTAQFPAVKDVYQGYIDECTDWYSEDEIKALRSIVDSIPDRDTLIHGDYHANNILVADGRLTLIDMGDVSVGHPVFDFLATAATQVNLVELNPQFAEIHTGMPVEMIRKLWRYLVDSYFDDKSPDEKDRIEQQIKLLSKLKVALAPAVAKSLDPDLMRSSVEDARTNLIPRADELIGAVNW